MPDLPQKGLYFWIVYFQNWKEFIINFCSFFQTRIMGFYLGHLGEFADTKNGESSQQKLHGWLIFFSKFIFLVLKKPNQILSELSWNSYNNSNLILAILLESHLLGDSWVKYTYLKSKNKVLFSEDNIFIDILKKGLKLTEKYLKYSSCMNIAYMWVIRR